MNITDTVISRLTDWPLSIFRLIKINAYIQTCGQCSQLYDIIISGEINNSHKMFFNEDYMKHLLCPLISIENVSRYQYELYSPEQTGSYKTIINFIKKFFLPTFTFFDQLFLKLLIHLNRLSLNVRKG